MPIRKTWNMPDLLQSDLQEEIKRRRKLDPGYILCTDEDILEEIRLEREVKPQKEAPTPEINLDPNDINLFLKDTFKNSWNYTQDQLDQAEPNILPGDDISEPH